MAPCQRTAEVASLDVRDNLGQTGREVTLGRVVGEVRLRLEGEDGVPQPTPAERVEHDPVECGRSFRFSKEGRVVVG